MRSASLLLTIVGFGSLGYSCQEGRGDETVRTDSAGVEIVRYTGGDHMLDWAIDTVVVLGGGNAQPGDSMFYDASDVHTDAAGNIYVLDRDAYRILTYDSTGTFSKSFGAQGGGPGEFQSAIAMDVTPDGTSGVLDYMKRAFVRFDSSGAPIDPIRIEGGISGGPVHQDGDDLILATTNVAEDRSQMVNALLRTNAQDTTVLVSFEREMGARIMIESCGIGFYGQGPIFTPSLRWAARTSSVATVSTSAYDVLMIKDSTPTLAIRRDLPAIQASEGRALESLGGGVSVTTPAGTRECDSQEVVDKRGFAEHVPAIQDLSIAPDGAVWVSRNSDEHDRNSTDIFDLTGVYLGTLPPTYPFPDAFVSNRTIVTRSEDEMGVRRVVVVRLTPTGET